MRARLSSCERQAPRRESRTSGAPTSSEMREGNIGGAVFARHRRAPRGRRTRARMETPRTGTGRSHDRLLRGKKGERQTASGSPRTQADDERAWEVRQVRSTGEVAEQCRRSVGGGGDGGKGPGEGKL